VSKTTKKPAQMNGLFHDINPAISLKQLSVVRCRLSVVSCRCSVFSGTVFGGRLSVVGCRKRRLRRKFDILSDSGDLPGDQVVQTLIFDFEDLAVEGSNNAGLC
jgi:hypothetical protein